MAYNRASRWKQRPNILGVPALNIRSLISAVPSGVGGQPAVPLDDLEIVGTEIIPTLTKIEVSFSRKKPSSSTSITSASFDFNCKTTNLRNPSLTTTLACGNWTLTNSSNEATITCSFTNQEVIAHVLGYVVLNILYSANANDPQSDDYNSYFPFGNTISLTSINGFDITAIDTTIEGNVELLVFQNNDVTDLYLTLTLEKEVGNIDNIIVNVWSDDIITLGDLTPSSGSFVVTPTVISEADPTSEFDNGVSYMNSLNLNRPYNGRLV